MKTDVGGLLQHRARRTDAARTADRPRYAVLSPSSLDSAAREFRPSPGRARFRKPFRVLALLILALCALAGASLPLHRLDDAAMGRRGPRQREHGRADPAQHRRRATLHLPPGCGVHGHRRAGHRGDGSLDPARHRPRGRLAGGARDRQLQAARTSTLEVAPQRSDDRAAARPGGSDRSAENGQQRWTQDRLARRAARRAARQRRHRRLQPRAVHPRARRRRHPRPAPGERPGHRARAGDARVLGHLDRARQRLGRPRDGRPRTTASRCRPSIPPISSAASGSRRRRKQGYYYGFANEGLWPLCHIAHVRPTFRTADWEHYRSVNAQFADAVVEEAKRRIRSCSCRTITSRCCRG